MALGREPSRISTPRRTSQRPAPTLPDSIRQHVPAALNQRQIGPEPMSTINEFFEMTRTHETARTGQATRAPSWLTALRRTSMSIAVFTLLAIGAVALRAWIYMPASFQMPAERSATFSAKDGIVTPWPALTLRAMS